MLWHTDTDEIEHGSWFRGTLYPNRMDLSWDGEYMVYLASGSDNQESWSGICRPPWLKTLVDWENTAVYAGGGFFDAERHLQISDLHDLRRSPVGRSLPFRTSIFRPVDSSGGYGVLTGRLFRDGWRSGSWRPTSDHPDLMSREFNDRWTFALGSHAHLLDGATWATWDSLGQLLVAQRGWIERYTLADLKSTEPKPSFTVDLNSLEPPPRPEGSAPNPPIL